MVLLLLLLVLSRYLKRMCARTYDRVLSIHQHPTALACALDIKACTAYIFSIIYACTWEFSTICLATECSENSVFHTTTIPHDFTALVSFMSFCFRSHKQRHNCTNCSIIHTRESIIKNMNKVVVFQFWFVSETIKLYEDIAYKYSNSYTNLLVKLGASTESFGSLKASLDIMLAMRVRWRHAIRKFSQGMSRRCALLSADAQLHTRTP